MDGRDFISDTEVQTIKEIKEARINQINCETEPLERQKSKSAFFKSTSKEISWFPFFNKQSFSDLEKFRTQLMHITC